MPLAIDRAHAGDAEVIKGLVRTFAGGDAFGSFAHAQGIAIGCHESGSTSAFYTRARLLYPGLVANAPDDSWDRLCATYRPGFADPAFFAPVEVTGASHGPLGRDDCTRSIATAFLAAPETAPVLDCMATRPALEFAPDGLQELFAPAG